MLTTQYPLNDLEYLLGHIHRLQYSYITLSRGIERLTKTEAIPRDVIVEAVETVLNARIEDRLLIFVDELDTIKQRNKSHAAPG